MYCKRYFRIRHRTGFSDVLVHEIAAAHRRWTDEVADTIAHWAERGVPGTPPPTYIFGEPELSEDRTVISMSLAGDPQSLGALKLFEDGVPAPLLADVPFAVLPDIAVSYENEAMGIAPGDWRPATAILNA